MGEVAQLLHSLLELGPELIEHGLRRLGVLTGDLACQPQVDGQADEPLLGAVVQIAFDPPTLAVTGGDNAGTRSLNLDQVHSHLGTQA